MKSRCLMTPFAAASLFLVIASIASAEPATALRFHLSPAPAPEGFTPVAPTDRYTPERGYGYDQNTAPDSGKPFYFSVKLPAEGNYLVTLTLGGGGHGGSGGDPNTDFITTVKSETRHLQVEQVHTPLGKTSTHTFAVNLRRPAIIEALGVKPGKVKLNARELAAFHWDDKLTLEISGPRPRVASIEIRPAPPEVVTIYVAGDSTVADQMNEPFNSWGQMLPRFVGPGVAVANHAESGRALRSFAAERRLDKILSQIRPGDWLLIQFGHNDQKEKGEGVGAMTTYKRDLKRYIALARERKANPVVVTPVSRRRFDDAGKVTNSLGDYPEAVRQVAKEDNVPLIDLNAMSVPLYEAWGVDGSLKAFVDNTHHNSYGSYELAKCIAEGLRPLPIGKHLLEGLPVFDPARPDPFDKFDLPKSPTGTGAKPEGN